MDRYNFKEIEEIYDYLTEEHKIETINPIVVRNEGVYDVPSDSKVDLIEAYKNGQHLSVLKAVKEAFTDDSIKFPTKALTDKFSCSNDIILKARKLLGIPAKGNVSYTCKKCGYTTNNKYKYKRHLNRENPCDRHKRWRAK